MDNKKGLTPEEIIMRGKAMEAMTATDGWKYLKDDLTNAVSINQANLERLAISRDIDNINGIAIRIKVYKYMLSKPQEYIKAKNDELKKGGNK